MFSLDTSYTVTSFSQTPPHTESFFFFAYALLLVVRFYEFLFQYEAMLHLKPEKFPGTIAPVDILVHLSSHKVFRRVD